MIRPSLYFLNLPQKVTFSDGSYLQWDYRPDGKKVKSTSSEKYIRVTVTVNSRGDTIVRERTMYNTDMRKYIGAFEISGNTWRVYHDAGHTDLNATSGALTHRYYVRDYLGSTRAVIDEEGNVLQSTAYYPSGVPLTPNELTPQTIKLHTGKDFFDLQGAGWYDNQARYYDCLIPTFKSQDPLAEKYPWLSPYCHCTNNPMKFVDPDGLDWVENNNTNEFVWMDNVTSYKNTPKGYCYIGCDNDLLSHLNISTKNIKISESKYGFSLEGDKNTGVLIPLLTKTILNLRIDITPNISTISSAISDLNKDGKTFNGITVKCILTQKNISSNPDLKMLYSGSFSVCQYDNSYKTKFFSRPTTSSYIISPNFTLTEASIFFSSKELTRQNSLHSAIISLGSANSNIFNLQYKNRICLMNNNLISPIK